MKMENQLEVKKLVYVNSDRIVTDSLMIAESFNKRHDDVLKAIRNLECSEEFSLGNFAESDYVNERGRKYAKYLISQDGFMFLAMGFTGKDAASLKEKFISEFNRMKNEINKHRLPSTYKEALLALVATVEENEKLQLQIETDRPLVTFAETALKSKDTILVRELSKISQDEGLNIGEKKLYTKLREWGLILKNSTEPSQSAMNSGYFVVEETNINTPYGIKLNKTTKVTPKGQIYIIEKLKKEKNSNKE
jgi:Rha family phage regulatory protein